MPFVKVKLRSQVGIKSLELTFYPHYEIIICRGAQETFIYFQFISDQFGQYYFK